MSVPAPDRKQSDADYVYYARKLAGYTIQKCASLIPKRYTFSYGQGLSRLALELYALAVDANGRWPTNPEEAQERVRLLLAAHGKARGIVALVELANESLHFPSDAMCEWMALAKKEVALIKGVIKSDRARSKK